MSRVCELSGTGVLYGHKVSHSQIKTNRRFEPNLHIVQFKSDLTGEKYKFRVTAKCIRSVDKSGGFDQYMLKVKADVLSDKAKKVRKSLLQLNQPALAISSGSL